MQRNRQSAFKWFATIAVVLLLALVTIPALVLREPPRYEGRTIREWIADIDPDTNATERRENANNALARIGADALPEIERILAGRSNRFDRLVATTKGLLTRLHLLKPVPPPAIGERELQSRACEAACTLATRTEVDIRRLIPFLSFHCTNGSYADSNSGLALAVAGQEGINALTNLMFTGTRAVRDTASAALRHRHTRTNAAAIAALTHMARVESDNQLRANALLYLKGSGGPAEQLVPPALESIASIDGYERWAAVLVLTDYPQHTGAVATLVAATEDSDPRVQSIARRFVESHNANATRQK